MTADVLRTLRHGGLIHVVNYHTTPRDQADSLDKAFAALADRYAPVTEEALDRYLTTGRWPSDKPGVIPAFYNGYRDNHEVALPALERHGLIGWFFAVPGYTSCPVADQLTFGSTRNLATARDEYPDGRYALSWEELREIEAKGHVVASHTRTHTVGNLNDPAQLRPEIVGAQRDFIRNLGHPVRAFAWLSGGRYGANPAADRAVDSAGYDFLFSNVAIQRLPQGLGRRQAE